MGLQPWTWHQGDKIEDLPDELYCTTEMKAERQITADPESLTSLLGQFCLKVVPWYYKNNTTATKGTQQMRDGDDICMPALWRKDRTLIAYSKQGNNSKTWELPPDWKGVKTASVSKITLTGLEEAGVVNVGSGNVKLSVKSGEALLITPAK